MQVPAFILAGSLVAGTSALAYESIAQAENPVRAIKRVSGNFAFASAPEEKEA